jgi:hypothetical protein
MIDLNHFLLKYNKAKVRVLLKKILHQKTMFSLQCRWYIVIIYHLP